MRKYKYYCKVRNTRDEIVHMTQGEYDPWRTMLRGFTSSISGSLIEKIDENSLKVVLSRGVRDEWMEASNIISTRDISKCYYDRLRDIFKSYSRAIRKNNDLKEFIAQPWKSIVRLTKMEIENLLDDMKTYIMY